MRTQEEVIRLFPEQMRFQWKEVAKQSGQLQEIRLRAMRPVMAYIRGEEYFLTGEGRLTQNPEEAAILSGKELEQILNHICRYSLYAHEEEMSKGYVSADGGFRIGVAGEVILGQDGSVKNLRNISSMNIRVPHEAKGSAAGVLFWLYENGRLKNTLIMSPPGCGKTTLLRDIVRLVSDGNGYAAGQTVGLVDERSEIAGCIKGVCRNDVGKRTDVLDGCPKALGMMMLLRSMAPQVVAVDELGSKEDVKALEQVLKCGCSVIATMHGDSWEELCGKRFISPLLEAKVFGRFLILGKKGGKFTVEKVLDCDGHILAANLK